LAQALDQTQASSLEVNLVLSFRYLIGQ